MFYGKQVALWLSQPALDTFPEEALKTIDSLLGEPVQKRTAVGGRLWLDPDCKSYGMDVQDLMARLSGLSAEKGEIYEVFLNDPWETGFTKQVFTNRKDLSDMMLDIQPVFTFGGFPITKEH